MSFYIKNILQNKNNFNQMMTYEEEQSMKQ